MIQHEIKIRKGEASDIPAIGHVSAYAVFVEDWQRRGEHSCIGPKDMKTLLGMAHMHFNVYANSATPCTGTWVADHEGKVVGYMMAKWHSSDRGEIRQIYVDPAYWGSNVGHDLFHKAEDLFRENDLKIAFLNALPGAQRAQAFYRKMGCNFVASKAWCDLYERRL
jgi:ribosomal protein S18 acetylase RimI-like enzyme